VTIAGLSAVPASALLLPAAVPALPEAHRAAITALREDVARALRRLPDRGTVVLLGSGDEPLVHDAKRATLASYGLPDSDVAVTIDLDLLAAVAARGQAPRVQSDRLDGDLAVLALLVADARPEASIVPVVVPRRADPSALSGTAAGLLGAATAVDRPVAVIAASDLAATLTMSSPGYLVEGSGDWDAAATAAVRAADPTAMAALGPNEADQVQARGWAPLTVLLEVAAALGHSFEEVNYHAPRGVGQLVAS
jgi:AmmeMemoRadiSam system protein B